MRTIQRISIELTNRCSKACWFCYNHSQPQGATEWTVDELVALATDCQAHGTEAISFGGGEPLQYEGVFELFDRLDGVVFRTMTTNGLFLNECFNQLVAASPDKVHVSIHFPNQRTETDRVIRQVCQLQDAGITSGVNLLVARRHLAAASAAAKKLHEAGIGNDRIVYLPMRGQDTPTPNEIATVAQGANVGEGVDSRRKPFQSMTCLSGCGKSERFCSIGWDRQVAWCSYTTSRHRLKELTYAGVAAALEGLPLEFCGGIEPVALQEANL